MAFPKVSVIFKGIAANAVKRGDRGIVVVIFLLILRVFVMSIKISVLEDKLRNLTEEIAVRNNMSEKK